jgi:hypothetical protein
MTNTYYMWTDNFDGTANSFKVENGIPVFTGVIKWPPKEGIEPLNKSPLSIYIKSYDSPRMVKKKTKKALRRYE